MKRNNQLDERQEQELLHIEHIGCWLAYWGLLAAIVVQSVFFPGNLTQIAGEWIVFLGMCIYLMCACLRRGIWDRRLKANAKTNALVSLIAALALGAVSFVIVFRNIPDEPTFAAITALIAAAGTFVLCFAALSLAARSMRKKQQKLEQEPEEDA